jgi:hypothetical protein
VNGAMLRLVMNDNRPADRLRLARAHIEIAIAHINNDAQTRVPSRRGSDHSETDELRVLVQALADIRYELTRSGLTIAQPAEAIQTGVPAEKALAR